jgi:hypothetical protein
MKKATLEAKVKDIKDETKEPLQTMYDALNQGQQKKIVNYQE